MLEQQLLDQRLHYEKVIARETVRLLEMGFQVQNGLVISPPSSPSLAECGGGGGGEDTKVDAIVSDDVFSVPSDECAEGHFDADSIAEDMEVIEMLKLEISGENLSSEGAISSGVCNLYL